jgi:hypothetical protein
MLIPAHDTLSRGWAKLSGWLMGKFRDYLGGGNLRETDTLVVWKLDRLGRSVKGLVDLVMNLDN